MLNLINVRTAKLHEYVALQTIKLEKIAKNFYEYKKRDQSWQDIKCNLVKEVENMENQNIKN